MFVRENFAPMIKILLYYSVMDNPSICRPIKGFSSRKYGKKKKLFLRKYMEITLTINKVSFKRRSISNHIPKSLPST